MEAGAVSYEQWRWFSLECVRLKGPYAAGEDWRMAEYDDNDS